MSGSRDDQKSPEEKALAATGEAWGSFSPDKRWYVSTEEFSSSRGDKTRLYIYRASKKFDKFKYCGGLYIFNTSMSDARLLWLPDSSGIIFFSDTHSEIAYIDLKTKRCISLCNGITAEFSSEAKLQMMMPDAKEKVEYDFPQISAIREKIKATLDEKAIDKEFKKVSTASGVRDIIMGYHQTSATMLELIEQFCEAQKFDASSRLPEAIRDQMEEHQDEYEYRIFLEKDEKSPDKDARAKKAAIEYLSTYLTEHPEKTPAECVAETVKQHPGAITFNSKKIKSLFESISKINEPKQVNASAGGLFAVDVKAENPPFIDFLQKWVEQNNNAADKKQLVAEVERMLKTAEDYQKKGILEVNVAKFAGVLQQKGVEGLQKFLDSKKVARNRKG